MKIMVNEKEHEVNISIGERNLLIMSDAPIEGIEGMLGKSVAELGDIGVALGHVAPIIKTLKGVAYEFLTQMEEAAALEREKVALESEKAALESEKGALETENAELKNAALEIEIILQDARKGLLSAPVPGEEWDAAKWYRSGDTVQGYECLKTCRGREPSASPLFWAAVAEQVHSDEGDSARVVAWADIENGATITVDTLVSHADKEYRCIKEHKKSVARQVTNTNFWEAVQE